MPARFRSAAVNLFTATSQGVALCVAKSEAEWMPHTIGKIVDDSKQSRLKKTRLPLELHCELHYPSDNMSERTNCSRARGKPIPIYSLSCVSWPCFSRVVLRQCSICVPGRCSSRLGVLSI